MPSPSITPGRKFSTTTSAVAARRLITSIALGFLRSSVIDRLPAFTAIQGAARPRFSHSLAPDRNACRSPVRDSTLDHVGAEQGRAGRRRRVPPVSGVKSRIFTPAKGLAMSPVFTRPHRPACAARERGLLYTCRTRRASWPLLSGSCAKRSRSPCFQSPSSFQRSGDCTVVRGPDGAFQHLQSKIEREGLRVGVRAACRRNCPRGNR